MSRDGVSHDPVVPTAPALAVYRSLLGRLKDNLDRLTTVQYDPETGVQKHFFNGKIERVQRVRLITNNPRGT